MKLAAIDIGSNAVRLLISNVFEEKSHVYFKKETLIRVPLRLGGDTFTLQRISEDKSEELIKIMIAFKYLMEVFKIKDYMACATASLREAKNGKKISKEIFEKTGIKVKIVTGQEESEIKYIQII